jgi:uncharacterized oligopeptide transporter (OPT) family protein
MNGPGPRAFDPRALPLYLAFAILASIICVQINVHLGITPNTSVIGVLVAIAAGRTVLPMFRESQRQLLLQTATSAGGFAGANIGLVSFATLALLGLTHLFWSERVPCPQRRHGPTVKPSAA